MKLILRKCLFFLAALTISCKSERVTIDVTADSGMALNGNWAYFFTQYGNQADIIDSCEIVDNFFRLSGNIPQSEVLAQIMIPHKCTYILLIAQGEKIKFHIDSTTRSFYPKAEGSYATLRMNDLAKRYREFGQVHRDSLKQEYGQLASDDSARVRIASDIRVRELELKSLTREAVNNKQSILLAIAAKMWYVDSNPEVDADSMKSIEATIRTHFPNSAHLPAAENRSSSRPTPSSIRAFNRKAQLVGEPLPYPDWKDKAVAPEPDSSDQITAYQIGDRVDNFTLEDAEGHAVSLNEIHTDYLLIDFWASWCPSCRNEMPQLVEAHKRYENLLTVYAVSVDEDAEAWQKAVKELLMAKFVNLRLTKEQDQFHSIANRFDVRFIPHNFLIDKDRRIIAIDLRGGDLEKKMKELTAK